MGGMKSLNSMFLNPFSRKSRNETGSARVIASQPAMMPQKLAAMVSRGDIRIHAKMRVAARNL